MLRVPPVDGIDDQALTADILAKVAAVFVEGDKLRGEERDNYVIEQLKTLEKNGGCIGALR